jgi:hypothetical protein
MNLIIITLPSLSGTVPSLKVSPYVSAEWLALLLRIREVPGSNLGPETGCSDRCFVVFLKSLERYI